MDGVHFEVYKSHADERTTTMGNFDFDSMLGESTGATLIKCTYGGIYTPIIKSVSIDYVKPTAKDLVIDISMTEEEAKERIAYVEEHGKGRYPMSIPVQDADGNHVATIDVVFYLMKK